jgi:hypothetical protein
LQLARRLDHPYTLAMVLLFSALVRQHRDEVEDCRRLAEEARTLAARNGFLILWAWAGVLSG